jgi:hypothetical protein
MTNLKTLELRQNKIFARMWINLFKEPIDAVSTNQSKRLNKLHLFFFGEEWNVVYNIIEFYGNSTYGRII